MALSKVQSYMQRLENNGAIVNAKTVRELMPKRPALDYLAPKGPTASMLPAPKPKF